jgi:hypothetical protein
VTHSPLVGDRHKKAIRTAALTMGLLTTAGAFAPAALAADGATPDAGTTTDATERVTPTATVLTPVPVVTDPATTTTGASYGTGKLTVTLNAIDGAPADAVIDATGARVRVQVDPDAGDPVDTTCTVDYGGCFGPAGYVSLPSNADVTLTLQAVPTAGGVILGTSAPSASGRTSATPSGSTVTIKAHGGYRTVGVALTGTGSRAGATFTLTPNTASTSGSGLTGTGIPGMVPLGVATDTAVTNAQGKATFPELHLPGSYTITQTTGPGGTPLVATPDTVAVPAATSLANRNATFWLTLPGPTTPSPTPSPTPTTTPGSPTSGSPVPTSGTPTSSTPPTSTPTTSTPTTDAAPVTPTTTAAPTPTTPAPSAAVPTIAPGKQQTITLRGFQPFELVRGMLHSTPVDLGTVRADADGVATFTFTVPAGLESGGHDVTMTGLTSSFSARADFTVAEASTATTTSTDGLAYTGTNVLPLLAVGGGLLAAGTTALVVAGRRRSA